MSHMEKPFPQMPSLMTELKMCGKQNVKQLLDNNASTSRQAVHSY